MFVFFFKQKTAYEIRISDWSSDVCSSDLAAGAGVLHHLPGRGAVACAARDRHAARALRAAGAGRGHARRTVVARRLDPPARAAPGERSQPPLAAGPADRRPPRTAAAAPAGRRMGRAAAGHLGGDAAVARSEEPTSALPSLIRTTDAAH